MARNAKKKIETERVSFVVTSKKWKSLFEEKQKKKAEEERKKAERKTKREENKLKKEKQKQQAQNTIKKKKCATSKNKANPPQKDGKMFANKVLKEESGHKLDLQKRANEPNVLKKNVGLGNKEKLGGLGLCYTCGLNIHDKYIECDLCDKIYHTKCLPKDFEIDELDPVFVCATCVDFHNEIINDVDFKSYDL